MKFVQLYNDVINKPLTIKFNEFYNISFYVRKEKDSQKIYITDNFVKGSDKLQFVCRKLSVDNWDIVYEQQQVLNKQKLILLFSLVESNFMQFQFDKYGFLKLQSLDLLIQLNPNIIKKIADKIYSFYKSNNDEQYKSKLLAQFRRLYNSSNGIVLKHKQISQYLQYCMFWQKFGLNYFDVKQLPYDVYRQFIMLSNIECDVKNAQLKKLQRKSKR